VPQLEQVASKQYVWWKPAESQYWSLTAPDPDGVHGEPGADATGQESLWSTVAQVASPAAKVSIRTLHPTGVGAEVGAGVGAEGGGVGAGVGAGDGVAGHPDPQVIVNGPAEHWPEGID